MAYIVPFIVLNQRRRQGAPPPSDEEFAVIAAVAAAFMVLVITLALIGSRRSDHDREQMRQAWDANPAGRPQAVSVLPGAVVAIPKSISHADDGWHNCDKSCVDRVIGHYPVVYPTHRLIYSGKKCRVLTNNNGVGQLRAAATTKSHAFTLELSVDGRKLTLCGPGGDYDTKFILWSDDPVATRE